MSAEFAASPDVCIHCHRHRSREAPGVMCTYGLAHEYPAQPRAKQVAKPDPARCSVCGLHPKNPAYATSACAHVHGAPT